MTIWLKYDWPVLSHVKDVGGICAFNKSTHSLVLCKSGFIHASCGHLTGNYTLLQVQINLGFHWRQKKSPWKFLSSQGNLWRLIIARNWTFFCQSSLFPMLYSSCYILSIKKGDITFQTLNVLPALYLNAKWSLKHKSTERGVAFHRSNQIPHILQALWARLTERLLAPVSQQLLNAEEPWSYSRTR